MESQAGRGAPAAWKAERDGPYNPRGRRPEEGAGVTIAALNFTFDPLDPKLLLFEGVWILVSIGLLVAAYKSKSGWMRAGLAGLGLSILGVRLLAVLPSWWLYYADGRLKWGGQGCAKIDLACIKQTAKDSIVVIQNAVVLGGFVVAFLLWQKKFPKQLAAGEDKPEATGGYK